MGISPRNLRIELLGGLRVRSNGQLLDHFQTQRTGALLAYLALNPKRRHLREELVDLLWPDAPLDAGRHRLSQVLTWLRPYLEPAGVDRGAVLRADRQTVSLVPQAFQTDVAEFEAVLRSASQAAAPDVRLQGFQQAVALYPGDLLPGYYDSWALAARERLLEGLLTAVRRIIVHYEEAQTPDLALDYARRAVAADPMSEEAHGDLIRLLNSSGQSDAAMRHYRNLEQILVREQGDAPTPATRSAVEPPQRSQVPLVRFQADISSPTLPAPLTRFFGREAELQQIVAQVQSGNMRLMTLLGPGGCGKTRLVVEAVHRLRGHFQGAVWFVPLADLAQAALIPAALAEALRMPHPSDSSLPQVIDALAARPSLLALDNLEHLAEAAAPVIQHLLERLPQLSVIVTSRQRLRLDGENEIAVPPLSVPTFGEGSVSPERLLAFASAQLFVDRVQAVRPAFHVTPENADRVAQLCLRLEGIPLAIELCAAWAQTLSLEEMQMRLTQRFDLLVSRRAGMPARHHTLRAAVEYSYVQLPPPLRRLFARLSLFRGGWTLEAADAVCRDTHMGQSPLDALTALTELRERSLITAEEAGGKMRYQMLETLREYAAEQLPPLETIRRRRVHAAYFLTIAEQAEPHLQGPDQVLWLERLEREIDNLRLALSWAAEVPSVDIGLRLAGALGPFWDARGYLEEGQTWLDRLLALPGSSRTARAKALNARGHLARNQGNAALVNAVMQEALALWREMDDEHGLATALQILATLAYSREDCDEAQTYLTEGLEIARKISNPVLVAGALLNLGNIALEQGEWAQAWRFYTESLHIYQAGGVRNRAAYALNNLGLTAHYQGEFAAAEGLLTEALAVCRTLSDRPGIAEALLNLGSVYRLQARYAQACDALREADQVASKTGERRILVWCLKELGHMACALNIYPLGIRLLSSAESLREAMGISFKPAGPGELARDWANAHDILGDTARDAAWASGAALPLAQARALFLSAMTELDKKKVA